jgi:hypothetical protein
MDTLGPSAVDYFWRLCYLRWVAFPGSHLFSSRATGRDGHVQTAVRATPFPDGSSGIQKLLVTVS